MDQKHVLWPALIIVLLVAAGALYYAWQLYGGRGVEAPPVTTDELEQADAQNEQDLSEMEADLTEFNAVDLSQDDLGI